VEVDIDKEQLADRVAVRVHVRLTGRETNKLFLMGDALIQLPMDDALPLPEDPPIPRRSIFLSELAGEPDGLRCSFADDRAAERFALSMRTQLQTALEAP
jgi:hypothetical protein